MSHRNVLFSAALATLVLAPWAPSRGDAQVPDYEIVSRQDLSFGVVRRFNLRVRVPRHYQREQIERIANAIVSDLSRTERLNAVSIMFYGPGDTVTGAWDVALVEWAPNGRWSDASTVRAGDYSSFRYSVTYRPPPAPTDTTSNLRSSRTRGLHGVPLPAGATLEKRGTSAPGSGRSRWEQYRVAASANEVSAYFNREMPKAGWQKDGLSSAYEIFFNKGNAQVDILINVKGGTFTLSGS